MINKFLCTGILISILLVSACEKPSGYGGNSSIKGKVIVESYDKDFRVLQQRYPAADENVYIIFGDEEIVGDDVETAPDGTFEFNYLRKGDYTIVAYSETDSVPGTIPVTKHVSITSNNKDFNAGEIVINEIMDIDDGAAKISGRVQQINWTNDYVFRIDTTNAQNVDVFMVYEDDDFVTERIRTLDDGRFAFPNLIKGQYKIYVLSEDVGGDVQEVPKIRTVTIENTDQQTDVGTIYIDVED